MRIAIGLAAVAALLAALCGCAECPDHPSSERDATFNLACNPNDLTNVVVSGPCADHPDAGLAWYTGAGSKWLVSVASPSPGVCHVELQFATGFTYAADVTFASQSDACGSYVGPTSGPYAVNNPADTCLVGDGGDGG